MHLSLVSQSSLRLENENLSSKEFFFVALQRAWSRLTVFYVSINAFLICSKVVTNSCVTFPGLRANPGVVCWKYEVLRVRREIENM